MQQEKVKTLSVPEQKKDFTYAKAVVMISARKH